MNQQELIQLINQAAADGRTELDLRNKGLTELPPEICKLSNLTVLKLEYNELTAVPPEIGKLTNLTSLNLYNNKLTAVPPEIGKLTSLTSLNLYNNKLTAIPPEIGQLFNLTSLHLTGNKLTAIPPEIGELTNLALLTLYANQLIAVPHEIGKLTNLVSLILYYNNLTTLPPEIGQLANLTKLSLYSNRLTAIPAEIGQLTRLTELILLNNQLTVIPPEIGKLTNLDRLSLTGNKLTAIPPEIGKLANLTLLELNYNQLIAVPPEIGQMTNLTRLKLSGNQLTTVPPEITQLTNLTEIDLAFNKLTAVPPEIGQMANMTKLRLSGNQLATIQPEIIQLTNLGSLSLRNIKLSVIPPEIGQLSNLTYLDLSANKLTYLPKQLKQLVQLKTLDLRGNPTLGISPEVLAQTNNPALILRTYFGKRRPLLEAKMLLVGQGDVGKTALARRLLHDLPPDDKQGKTAGVDIQKWAVEPSGSSKPQGSSTPVTLNLWDFGGQGVYQATHQFFFTSRSLYLVVINARTGEQESRLHHWLKLVDSLSKKAPVIIVVNKQDEYALSLDERELRYKYPNLLHVIPTSCVTGAGIPQLRTAIAEALTQLPHIHDHFPLDWFDLKTQLEQMDNNYITYERYTEYCEATGIKSKADQRSWVQVLHHLGVVLNYQDDNYRQLAGTHVLKPEWVTDGVYRILSDPGSQIAQNNGILTVTMLDNILDPDNYPRHQQHFIVEMMRKFELSFRIPHRPDQYLIPDLLPKERPPQATFPSGTSRLHFQVHYADFLPSSILSRFMVGMMTVLEHTASWRNGAVLKFENNSALVLADLEARKIFINISGSESTRHGLLNSIRMQLHAIHSTFPNLTLTEHVPIPDQSGKTIAYHALCNLEAKSIERYYDPVNDIDLDVKELLAGIETPTMRRERQLQKQLDEQHDLDGLMQLCFELDVDYDNLPGQTKSAKTRELVQFMGRNGRLDDLAGQLGRS